MNPLLLAAAGAAILLFAWAGPLPGLVPGSFAAHMALHMLVVGIGVPVLALGLVPHLGPLRWPLALPVAASLVDLVVVWLWHVPALHEASRSGGFALALEQLSFAAAALLVWLVALGGPALAGALTLFFTSMHMTLLGALLSLGSRHIYAGHLHGGWLGLSPVEDQQAGGVVMLAIGGVVYLAGGLWLASRVLRPVPP
jgi:putative membrane protein